MQKKRIKTSKRNTLKNDALNALLMIPINGPQLATLKAKELMKQTTLQNIWTVEAIHKNA